MGQQSVGKSFALNHLVDTSFAGSAMRTTGTLYLLIIWDQVYMYRGCMVVRDAHR
jgi:hypothetical protein